MTILLQDLEVYKLSLKLSKQSWTIYESMDWRLKKIIGDQFIQSVDSIGANISEACGRYYYLDKIRFFYISRGSVFEAKHWLGLLAERNIINNEVYLLNKSFLEDIAIKLNSLIKAGYRIKYSNY